MLEIMEVRREERQDPSCQGARAIMGGGEILGTPTAQRKETPCTLTTIMSSKARDVGLENRAVLLEFL